jgi:hypothetical protein
VVLGCTGTSSTDPFPTPDTGSTEGNTRTTATKDLAKLIDRADKLIVLEGPREGCAVLFESSDRKDLNALRASLRVEDPKVHEHCKCDGTPAIVLYANKERIGQITNHHAKLIRCDLWESDARLAEVEPFLKWFDDRKLTGPRKEYEAGIERDKQWKENQRKWVEALPPAVRKFGPLTLRPSSPNLALLAEALEKEIPDKNERILALFAWFGSGEGPWSGIPAYEENAERMILDYSTKELLAAIEGKELTAAQTEGVARLFAGYHFSLRRPNDLQLLPDELKARLLKHAMASTDEDKRSRAHGAFGKD